MELRGSGANSVLRACCPLDPDAFPEPSFTRSFCPSAVFDLLTRPTSHWDLTPSGCCLVVDPDIIFDSRIPIRPHQRPGHLLQARFVPPSVACDASHWHEARFPELFLIRVAQRMTDIAPMMSNRRISRCPIFDVRPKTCLPPVECCRGTRPSQAAKSRLRLNTDRVGAKAFDCHGSDWPKTFGHRSSSATEASDRCGFLFQRWPPSWRRDLDSH